MTHEMMVQPNPQAATVILPLCSYSASFHKPLVWYFYSFVLFKKFEHLVSFYCVHKYASALPKNVQFWTDSTVYN